jgi:hypothetical protein
MTSERQREANRANARRSTGPRSPAGKCRASRNAVRHGLTADLQHNPAWSRPIEALARQYAPGISDEVALAHARDAAAAQLQVQQVRHACLVFTWDATRPGGALSFVKPRVFMEYVRRIDLARKNDPGMVSEEWDKILADYDEMVRLPIAEPARSAAFLSRAIEQLTLFARYQDRAAARRDDALQQMHRRIVEIMTEYPNTITAG